MSVANPCRGICKLHPIHKICIGCYRSTYEKIAWLSATDEEKEEILEDLEIKKNLYGDLTL